jgi:hypothetical protein
MADIYTDEDLAELYQQPGKKKPFIGNCAPPSLLNL